LLIPLRISGASIPLGMYSSPEDSRYTFKQILAATNIRKLGSVLSYTIGDLPNSPVFSIAITDEGHT